MSLPYNPPRQPIPKPAPVFDADAPRRATEEMDVLRLRLFGSDPATYADIARLGAKLDRILALLERPAPENRQELGEPEGENDS